MGRTKIPFTNHYKTKKTLGKDRIAAVAGGIKLQPGKNLMIVDIGTCMTVDFVDKEGNYWGGNISPGVNLRLRAMHQFTSSLPLIKAGQVSNYLGLSTKEAIRNGAIWGFGQ